MTEPAVTVAAPAGNTWWAVIRDAIRGVPHDYTAGSLNRAIVLLAIPMVLEMVMESVFAVVDVFWVAHLGADAVATVGLTESMLTLVYTAGDGLSIGAAADGGAPHRARRTRTAPRRRPSRRSRSALVRAPPIVAALGVALAPRLLGPHGRLPGRHRTRRGLHAHHAGRQRRRSLLLFLINAIFRGAGDAAIAMRVLWLANTINIVLGPCLIFGLGPFPELGVTGAAVATTIGRGTARALSAVPLEPRRCARVRPAGAPRARAGGDDAPAAPVGLRHLPGPRRHGELDRAGAHPLDLRQRRARRLHDRHPARDLRAAAVVGHVQRRRDDGGADPRRAQPGPRRAGGVDRRRGTTWCSSGVVGAGVRRARRVRSSGSSRSDPRCRSDRRPACAS